MIGRPVPPRSRSRLKGQMFRHGELFELLIAASIPPILCDLRPTLAVQPFGELALLAAICLRRARAKMPTVPNLRNMDRPAIHIFHPEKPSISLGSCDLREICSAHPFGDLALRGTTCSPRKGEPSGRGKKAQKCQQLALFDPSLEAAIQRFLCDFKTYEIVIVLRRVISLGDLGDIE